MKRNLKRTTEASKNQQTSQVVICNDLQRSSLRSRRLEVVGTRKNRRARGRNARGEGHLLGKPTKIVSRPQSNHLAAVA